MRIVASFIDPEVPLEHTYTIPSSHFIETEVPCRANLYTRTRKVRNINPELVTWCEHNLKSFTIYQDGTEWKLNSCAEDHMLMRLKFE